MSTKLLCFLFFIFIFSNFNPVQSSEGKLFESIGHIMENQDYCVAGFDEGKIYLKPEVISTKKTGIFVAVNAVNQQKIPFIFSDSRGLFITGGRQLNSNPWFCLLCGWPVTMDGSCTNPNCPRY